MSGSFIATAGDIKINHALRTDNAKRIHTLGRKIDAPLGGRSRDEEHFLAGDELLQFRRNSLVPVRHWPDAPAKTLTSEITFPRICDQSSCGLVLVTELGSRRHIECLPSSHFAN